jgi:hypothetical protein
LPKELKLAGTADIEAANAFQREVYLPAYNATARDVVRASWSIPFHKLRAGFRGRFAAPGARGGVTIFCHFSVPALGRALSQPVGNAKRSYKPNQFLSAAKGSSGINRFDVSG